MAKKIKKVVNVLKKKPMKYDNKKKQFLLKILQYLESDNYMFASLFSPNCSNTFAPEPEGILENVSTREEGEVVKADVEDYVNSDCYLYAPLIMPQPWLKASGCISGGSKGTRQHTESMKKQSEDRPGEKERIICEDKLLSSYPRTKNTVVTRKISKNETVKQILRSPSEPDKVPPITRGRRAATSSKKVVFASEN
ncbi:hypothetical protein Leryth_015400 [Lithospermum erythrorhizon]|nr:hypothetical protein Leryth_015400 [Lithospermum erythrorhizon]